MVAARDIISPGDDRTVNKSANEMYIYVVDARDYGKYFSYSPTLCIMFSLLTYYLFFESANIVTFKLKFLFTFNFL